MRIYTIGHSTLEFDEFVDSLKSFGIQTLIDVRSMPGSRRYPHFNQENMAPELARRGIDYIHFPKLGGRRKSQNQDDYQLVAGWRNISFKNYASYTLTAEYSEGISELLAAAEKGAVCIMCAEAVPWKCHRLLISNTLWHLNVEVFHIMGSGEYLPHELNRFGARAEVSDNRVIYP